MYFYAEKEDRVEKYRVSYDKELIENLRDEIIDECSLIEHWECNSSYDPKESCYYTIKKSSYKYIYPQLVLYINEFLKGNIQIIGTGPETTDVVAVLKKQIESLSKEIDSIDGLELEQKQKKQEELKRIAEQLELNRNQKSTSEYFEKFNNLVGIELVDTLLKEKFGESDRVNSFYERENTGIMRRKRQLV